MKKEKHHSAECAAPQASLIISQACCVVGNRSPAGSLQPQEARHRCKIRLLAPQAACEVASRCWSKISYIVGRSSACNVHPSRRACWFQATTQYTFVRSASDSCPPCCRAQQAAATSTTPLRQQRQQALSDPSRSGSSSNLADRSMPSFVQLGDSASAQAVQGAATEEAVGAHLGRKRNASKPLALIFHQVMRCITQVESSLAVQ